MYLDRYDYSIGMSYLVVAFFGELDAVTRDHLMDLAVFIALGLCMADEDDQAWFDHCCRNF